MSWEPNRYQAQVLRTYADGDYAYICDGEGDSEPCHFAYERQFEACIEETCGDTLLLFLVRELSGVDDGEEAQRLVQQAIDDLKNILMPVSLI